jgi:alpha-1,2-mannosyltransferase
MQFQMQAGIVGIDYYAYRKLEVVPLNIVLYNVFSGPGKGPDIYGTEPWWFYLANLSLNFNLLLPLALASGPTLVRCLHSAIRTDPNTPRSCPISCPGLPLHHVSPRA